MRRPLVDPRLYQRNENHWPSICTIQTANTSVSGSGQKTKTGTFTNVAGLVSIPCRIAPVSQLNVSDKEARAETIQALYSQRELKLNGFFPQIQPRTMLAFVDGVRYEIRGVESDSQSFSTRMLVEIIS